MPGKSGVEAAQHIGRRAQLVFVTAFDQYAVQAFAQGALDYLVKPVEPARLAETVARLRERMNAAPPDVDALLARLEAQLAARAQVPRPWLRAQAGPNVRLIAVDEVDYLRSGAKYTLVAFKGDDGKPAEALVRTSLKELADQLDPAHFAQVHRGVIVNLRAVRHVARGENETAELHLKGRTETLPVSRSYLHLFRQM
jgi:DNA-binding LytR/AlgR family response regulator